jgi:hypothetical protein
VQRRNAISKERLPHHRLHKLLKLLNTQDNSLRYGTLQGAGEGKSSHGECRVTELHQMKRSVYTMAM